jgi:uncharacterized protein (DUF169 family)
LPNASLFDGSTLKVLGSRLVELLRLRTLPVAMRLLARPEELADIPGLRRPKTGRRFSLCQLVGQCRITGITLGVTADNLLFEGNCGAIPGLHPIGEDYLSGRKMEGVWFENLEAAREHQEAIPRLAAGKSAALAISPLRTARLDNPEVALFYGTPAQMILFINGLQWKRYQRYQFTVTGETACADSWGRALKFRTPSLSIPCFGERRYGGVAEDELLMALPPEDLACAINGLEALSKAGLRYPIPPYGMQFDPGEGMEVSYGSPAKKDRGAT